MNDFRYIPENEIVGDILGWTPSEKASAKSSTFIRRYSFYSRLIDIFVYSYFMGSSNETHSLQDMVDEGFPYST